MRWERGKERDTVKEGEGDEEGRGSGGSHVDIRVDDGSDVGPEKELTAASARGSWSSSTGVPLQLEPD